MGSTAAVRAQNPWLKRARRTRRLKAVGRVVGLVVLALVIYVVVTFVQVVQAANDDGDPGAAEAIVVLGAAQYDGEPSPVLQARLDHAAGLYEQGVAPVVVVTGGRQAGDRVTEAQASAGYLGAAGVPDGALLREVHGASSYESLAAAARILADEDIDDVVLVSSPYHALRTRLIAEEVGLEARASPADVESDDISGMIGQYARETVAVAAGRIVGYRRLGSLDDRVGKVRSRGETG